MKTLHLFGCSCSVNAQDLERWFQAATPYPDITLEEVIKNPLLVVHEIVEIDEVMRSGIDLGRDVITGNLALVDRAHLKAAQIELDIAFAEGEREHILERMKDIDAWSKDPLTEPEMRRRFSELANRTAERIASSIMKGEKEEVD